MVRGGGGGGRREEEKGNQRSHLASQALATSAVTALLAKTRVRSPREACGAKQGAGL